MLPYPPNMWPHRWRWLDLQAAGHPKQTEGQAACLGGGGVLPEPVPGAQRSQMSLPGNNHSTCLSSWEEVAGLAEGTGWEATRPCTPCTPGESSVWRVLPASAISIIPGLLVLSCSTALPDSTAQISRDLFLFSHVSSCLGQVNHTAPNHVLPLGYGSK